MLSRQSQKLILDGRVVQTASRDETVILFQLFLQLSKCRRDVFAFIYWIVCAFTCIATYCTCMTCYVWFFTAFVCSSDQGYLCWLVWPVVILCLRFSK